MVIRDQLLRFSTNNQVYNDAFSAALMADFVSDPDFSLANDESFPEKALRDPILASKAAFRKHMVAGSSWMIEPASDSDADKQAAEIIEETLSRIHRFSEVLFNLSDAVFRGMAWGFPEGSRKTLSGPVGGGLKWWVPTSIKDVDKRRFRLFNKGVKLGGLVNGNGKAPQHDLEWRIWSTIKTQYIPFDRSRFIAHTYSETERSLHHGAGLWSHLFHFFRAKVVVLREMLMSVERTAQGFKVYNVDTTAKRSSVDSTNEDMVARAKVTVEKHMSRHWLFKDMADKIEILDLPANGWNAFQTSLEYLDNAMTTLILGSTLPTGGQAGTGSLARAEVEERSTEVLIRYDRKNLEETLERDLIGMIWRMNRVNFIRLGIGNARPPFFKITHQKEDTPQAWAAIFAQVMPLGIKIREDEFYDKLGLTPPMEDDKVIEAPAAPAAAAPFSAAELLARDQEKKRKKRRGYEEADGSQITASQDQGSAEQSHS